MRKLSLPILLALAALIPTRALALQIPGDWTILCGVVPCTGAGGGGAAGLSAYIFETFVNAIELGFVAAAVLVLFFATVSMVMFSGDENVVKEGRTAFIYTIAGAAVVSLARWFALAFSPTEVGGALVNQGVTDTAVDIIVTFFKLLLSVILTVNIVIQAMRLISSQGEQDQVDKARKRLLAGFIGVAIVLLANTLIVNVTPTLGNSSNIAREISGVANYLVTILGFAAVVAIIVAGIMLVVSADESLKDKAKTLIKTAIVALVVVLVSYALVTAFIAI